MRHEHQDRIDTQKRLAAALRQRLQQRAAEAEDYVLAVEPMYSDPKPARIEAREALDRVLQLWPDLGLPLFPYGFIGGKVKATLRRLREALLV